MSVDLKSILRGQQSAEAHGGKVKVLVALRTGEAEQPVLDRLERLGLEVECVMGNKLVGAIERTHLVNLRGDPDVQEVEESVRLPPL